MKKHIIIGTLFALVLLASVARASETVERTDLADIFQGFDGTFIMYDEGADRYTVFSKTLSETRLPPCSTFKVFHALIGLDSGVLDRDDARTLMKWNGKPSSIAAWNHDQTLASAMRHSVVWYFQRVATGIGEERMQRGLDRIGYGNRDISGGLTRFWLQSSLKISPREQVGLLRALFNGSLPFAAEDIDSSRFPIAPAEVLGMIVVPLVAFDRTGARLGYGGGCYDRYLPMLSPACQITGIAFDEQRVEHVPTDAHDLPLPHIIGA